MDGGLPEKGHRSLEKGIRKEIKMGKTINEQKIEMESKLVRTESMSILKEFRECEDLSRILDYSSDDFESSDE